MSVLMQHLAILPQIVDYYYFCVFLLLSLECVSVFSLGHWHTSVSLEQLHLFYLMHSHNSVTAVDFAFSVAIHAVSKSLLTPHPQLFQRQPFLLKKRQKPAKPTQWISKDYDQQQVNQTTTVRGRKYKGKETLVGRKEQDGREGGKLGR